MYRLVITSFNWLAGLFSGERLHRVLALRGTDANLLLVKITDRNQGRSMLQIIHSTGIVNRGEWLGSPANIKRANKDAKI